MRRIHGECKNTRLQILDVVDHVLILGVSEDLRNKIDRGFRRRMDLFAQIPLDQVSQLLLVRHGGFVYHLALLKRQPLRNMSYRDVVAVCNLPPQG